MLVSDTPLCRLLGASLQLLRPSRCCCRSCCCPVMFLVCPLWLVSLMLLTPCTFWRLFCCCLLVMILLCLLLLSLQFLTVAGFHTVAYIHFVACVPSKIACLWCFWYICCWWCPFFCLLLLALLLPVPDPTDKSAVAKVLSIAHCGCWHPFCFCLMMMLMVSSLLRLLASLSFLSTPAVASVPAAVVCLCMKCVWMSPQIWSQKQNSLKCPPLLFLKNPAVVSAF